MNNPFISIIIPTYNRGYCIANAIESILNQTYQNFEIIVVDDCSSDNTMEVIKSINDERIVFHRNSRNIGPASSRNQGIKLSRYDYIAFQDSDDIWEASKLEKQINMCINHNNPCMVYTKMIVTDNDTISSFMPSPEMPFNKLSENVYPYLLEQNFIGAPTVLLPKAIIYDVGGFRDDLSALEDWELFLRIAKRYDVLYIDEPLHIYNVHTSNTVSSNYPKYLESMVKILCINKEEYLKHGLFNNFTEKILLDAQAHGLLSQISKLLTLLLQI